MIKFIAQEDPREELLEFILQTSIFKMKLTEIQDELHTSFS